MDLTYLSDIFDRDLLATMVDEGYVARKESGDGLVLFNYTPLAQYGRIWNEVTEQCRGLIANAETEEIVARPLRKFFNYGEVRLPAFCLTKRPMVTTKVDGSLGIFHRGLDSSPRIATRGSFGSEQAVWATKFWEERYADVEVPQGVTPLVEIIYPDNQIVINYKGREDLILLGVIDIATGADIPLWEASWWPGPIVKTYHDIYDLDKAYQVATNVFKDGEEGLVVCWYQHEAPSFRLKIKDPEYIRLHSLVTECSSLSIWRLLSNDMPIDELLDNVPDEFYQWVTDTVRQLIHKFNEISDRVMDQYDKVEYLPTRKDQALALKDVPERSMVFRLLDEKSYGDIIWKQIRPKYERPFRVDPDVSIEKGRI